MTTDHQHIKSLLDKALHQQLSAAEMKEFLELAGSEEHESAFMEAMEKQLGAFSADNAEDIHYWMERRAEVYEQLIRNRQKVPVTKPRLHFMKKWGWAAASIILVLGLGGYLWMANKRSLPVPEEVAGSKDIAPGRNGAVLTLADGSQVVLDSMGNGVVATQNGTKVLLQNSGLAYDPTGPLPTTVAYNIMTTPKGRQFRVILPDGTKVWINAASSIRYPTVFVGTERRVTVSGEVYFEVAKNAKMPFIVDLNGHAEVEVLGTHFNVNSYSNEQRISTTLLEGAIRVRVGQSTQNEMAVVLKPGQQAQIVNPRNTSEANHRNDKIQVVNNADIDQVMAWKNGLFNFDGQTFTEVLRQMERWYDIDVNFESNVPDVALAGNMSRDVTLNGVLRYFNKENIHYRLEGRKLTILP